MFTNACNIKEFVLLFASTLKNPVTICVSFSLALIRSYVLCKVRDICFEKQGQFFDMVKIQY